MACTPTRLPPSRLSTPTSVAHVLPQGTTMLYKNMLDCLRVMVATEGAGSLFLGLLPTLVRSVPNLGIQFLAYELIKRELGLAK